MKEEYKICCQKIADGQRFEWNLPLSDHLQQFLKTSTSQLNDLLLQLQNTSKLIEKAFTIFGETIYPDHKTLDGQDMSVIFLGTVTKVVALLANTKKDLERSGDFGSPRNDDEGSHTNGGKRRWSVSHTKSSRSIDHACESAPPPPPPPPPPKVQETISPTSELESMTMPAHSPENMTSSIALSTKSNSSPSPTPLPSEPSETTDSTKPSKEKTKGEKSNRPARSKARIATL